MKNILLAVRHFFSERFNLNEDRADEALIAESIKRDVQFKGANLWTLIFAIFIASIGLNVNSTAVIIGAMLISPLMGPIMGIGLGIGTNDLDLVKRGMKNLVIAVIISVATSSLYFTITPLHDASSELLARTNPSLWDVFIALLGGLAGIVAGTRREKSNVIPGVAIATALMPPLCTAGYGLATGNWFFFLGAFYLFFINCIFICLATVLMVKHLRFHKKEFNTPERERRISRYMLIVVIITVLPSIYLAYRIVKREIFERNARKFLQTEMHFARTQVVTHAFLFEGKPTIDLLLVGQPLSDAKIDSLRNLLPHYQLDSVRLVVHQGLDARQRIDLSEIKASVLEEVFANGRPTDTTSAPDSRDETVPDLRAELRVLYPQLLRYSLNSSVFHRTDVQRNDTLLLFVGKFSTPPARSDRQKLGNWLKERLKADSLHVLIE